MSLLWTIKTNALFEMHTSNAPLMGVQSTGQNSSWMHVVEQAVHMSAVQTRLLLCLLWDVAGRKSLTEGQQTGQTLLTSCWV